MTDLGGRSGELLVFVAIVSAGGVSAGARSLGLVPSTASRMLRRFEERVGARLIIRESRAFRLTREGENCYRTARRILADIDELERTVGDGLRPRGILRVSASVAFGRLYVLPMLNAFRDRYPDVTVQVSLTDRVVDLSNDEADVAIRIGRLPDSELRVRKLGESPRVLVASPSYLDRYGVPATPKDLSKHVCLRLMTTNIDTAWTFEKGDDEIHVVADGPIVVDNGEALVQLTVAGHGLARIGKFHIASELASGSLVPVLEDFGLGENEVIQAVFVGQPFVPGRVRAFVDFLAEYINLA